MSLQQLRLSQLKARNQELKPGLPCGCQRPKYLNHHLLIPSVHSSSNMKSEVKIELECRQQQHLNIKPKACHEVQDLKALRYITFHLFGLLHLVF